MTSKTLTGTNAAYVLATNGLTLTNDGTVSGSTAFKVTGTNDVVFNAGLMAGGTQSSGVGVLLTTAGTFTNQSAGVITGFEGIQDKTNTVTLVNAGTITGDATRGVGVYLQHGGSFLNLAGGVLSGLDGLKGENFATTVENAGTIDGGTDAVLLGAGFVNRVIVDPGAVFAGTVDGGNTLGSTIASTLELAAGTIAGTITGLGTQFIDFADIVVDAGASWTLTGANQLSAPSALIDDGTLTNAGTLNSPTKPGTGVTLGAGAELINAAGATILAANNYGVYGTATASAVTVVNAGLIQSSSRVGVQLLAGGFVTNQATGTISGTDGVEVAVGASGNPSVSVTNAGTIRSGGYGVDAGAGGTVLNQLTGTISATYAVELAEGGTLIDAGALIGTSDAVRFHAGWTGRLIIDPGATFTGTVDGGNTFASSIVSTLELASGASAGTLTGLGTQFIDFAQITLDSKATWTLGGANTLTKYGVFTASGTLTNAGTFGGTLGTGSVADGSGITLTGGAVLINQTAGTLGTVSRNAVVGIGGASTVENYGVIAGNSFAGAGVMLQAGGSVFNRSGGTISGAYGVHGTGVPITVVNTGQIVGNTAASGDGIRLDQGGSVTNQASGTIFGDIGVYGAGGLVTVVNAGSIGGHPFDGIYLRGGGVVTNQSGGTIGGEIAVQAVKAAATVVNVGSIGGGQDSVLLAVGYANRVVVDPGASFTTKVDGGNTLGSTVASTLELGSGASTGTLTGLGTQFIDFGQIIVDPGATWVLSGANTVASGATLTDNGTLTNGGILTVNGVLVDSATFTNTASITGGGITVGSDGLLSNTSSAVITSSGNGVVLTGAGATVANAGKIAGGTAAGSGYAGVDITGADQLTNLSTGTISGYEGVAFQTSAGLLANTGLISGAGIGVFLDGGGTVSNASGGTISSRHGGILADNAAAGVINAGRIAGYAGVIGLGVQLTQGGSVTNQTGGTITGAGLGIVVFNAAGSVVNSGSIGGAATAGVYLTFGGSVTNQAGGTITGADAIMIAGGTVVNAGVLNGGTDAVSFAYGVANRLVDDPGATFIGTVDGGNPLGASFASTLELASGSAAGTLTGLGTQFIDFAQVTIDSSATWTLSSANRIGAGGTLTDSGRLTNIGSVLDSNIVVTTGGTLINTAGATIANTAGSAVILTGSPATVVNSGSIAGGTAAGSGYAGVDITGAEQLTNLSTGIISGYEGVAFQTSAGLLANTGLISGAGIGVFLDGGGTVSNASGGTISSRVGGILANNAAAGVVNAGRIAGNLLGVQLTQGGSVTNQAGGTITGAGLGIVVFNATGSVVNSGSIGGAGTAGVYLAFGGSVTNQAGGTITGADAITVAGGTVVNAGVLNGGTDAVSFAYGVANRLVDDPGATFIGSVDGGNPLGASFASTLELASGTAAGTLTGLGTQFIDFGHIVVDAGASWVFSGANTVAAGATLTNAGTLAESGTLTAGGAFVNSGSLIAGNGVAETIDAPSLTGTGLIEIGSNGMLVLNVGSVAPAQTIDFTDATGILTLGTSNAIGGFAGTIGAFAVGDTIVVDTAAPAAFSQSGSIVSVTSGGSTLGRLAFASTQLAATAFTTPGALEDHALCFLPDTLIATPAGEVPVQHLRVGGSVLTATGAVRPITWIGTGRVRAERGRRTAATPVIVRKNAIGRNRPHHDLRVTKGHSLLFDGVLIPVEFLVNHRSILWDDRAQEVSLYHVELDAHDVLLANGVPAESYRDDGNRWLFNNLNERRRRRSASPCAPVLTGGPVVDAVWQRLLGRAGRRPGLPLTDDPDLHLLADGARVDATSRRGDAQYFVVTNRPRSLRIRSRASAPAELGLARDPRVLGVALRRIAVRQGWRLRHLALEHEAFTTGFHGFEPDNGMRWTNGDAEIPSSLLDAFDGPMEVELVLGGATRYAAEHAPLRS